MNSPKFIPFLFSFFFLAWAGGLFAQPYDPGADQPGTRSISHQSKQIRSWATEIRDMERGWKNKAMPDSGRVSAGEPGFALGPALSNGVVSLGDGGFITLGFKNGIANEEGPDFAVFENGFGDEFLELATVEVSSDGKVFVPFPSVSLTPVQEQVWSFGSLDPRNLHNLAGKYRVGFGTPFDLEELKNEPGLDVMNIRYVRVRDVVGSILPELGTRDSKGNLINDPYPTAFPTGGFDLDAIGVLHEADTEPILRVYPSVIQQGGRFILSGLSQGEPFLISDSHGKRTGLYAFPDTEAEWTASFPKGLYVIQSLGSGRKRQTRLVVL